MRLRGDWLASRCGRGLLWLATFVLAGCTTDPSIQFIPVANDEPCYFVDCGSQGVCATDEDGVPGCLCNVGYVGVACESCERGFHRDGTDRCVSNLRCVDQPTNPCGDYGECQDRLGVIECACEPGYVGPRCNVCDTSYRRDEIGRCLPVVIIDNPPPAGSDGGVVDSSPGGCESGYTGAGCVECAPGYHRDRGACRPDDVCTSTSCSANGVCSIADGRVQCECAQGYHGAQCNDCAAGYVRSGAYCVAAQSCGPETCPTRATCAVVGPQAVCTCLPGWEGPTCDHCVPTVRQNFESAGGWPEDSNTCFGASEYFDGRVTFRSMDGTADVLLCAQGTISGFPTKHIEIEAGPTRFAEIVFVSPVRVLSFDYASQLTAISVDVLRGSEDLAIARIDLPKHSSGTLYLEFDSPVSVIRFRSRTVFRQVFGVDNLEGWASLCN